MKFFIVLSLVFIGSYCKAQIDLQTKFIKKIPVLKNNVVLIKTNSKISTSTKNWIPLNDTALSAAFFDIQNKTNADGEKVQNIKALGWWGLGEKSIAYLFAYDTKINNVSQVNIYISSFSNGVKNSKINPFETLPSPTGMQGKITVTKKVAINTFGRIDATTTYKSNNGKVLSKSKSYFINEQGQLTENN